MKVIFFGTPQYAVPSLEALIGSSHEVVAIVSQPDKPKGRSAKLVPTPVKEVASRHNIPIFQYEKIRTDDISELLKIEADVMVSCAYGQILGKNILFSTRHGVINLHGSILPKYRGSSPIQWALINGEKVTGVTVLRSDIGMDDGDILTSDSIEIDSEDNAITLFDKLSLLSAKMIVPALDLIESGRAVFSPQDDGESTKCSMLTQALGEIDFNKTTDQIVGLIKGLAMWPNAHITIDGVYYKLFNAKKYDINIAQSSKDIDLTSHINGEVVIANNKQGLIIKCSDGLVEITELLPKDSKKMTAKSYLNGKKIKIGSMAK